MSKVVIVGNSAAGFSFIQAIAEKKPSGVELVVISKDGSDPYRKDQLIDYILGEVEESSLFLADEDFYRVNNISYLKGAEVMRLEAQKKRLLLRDNRRIEYDYLIIASGRSVELGSIPGKGKDGVILVNSLQDARRLKQRLTISQFVCFVGGQSQWLNRLASRLGALNKEIKIINPQRSQDFVNTDNVEWLDNVSVVEFIGEGPGLQAVKLSNGKIIGVSLVAVFGPSVCNTRFLKDSGVAIRDGFIVVDNFWRTATQDIFACGSVCFQGKGSEDFLTWHQALEQGKNLADVLVSFFQGG